MSSPVARKALQNLLARAERAKTRDAGVRGLPFTKASVPDYFLPHSLADLNELHSELVSAERAGAITIQWDRRSGDRGQITRIDLVDADALAKHLGVTPHWVALSEALVKLTPWNHRPQVTALIDSWKQGRRPRERGPEAVDHFIQAMKVIDSVEAQPPGTPMAVRRLSARLFNDSKIIESLNVELDLLTRADEGPPRTADEIYAELGLQRFPAPFAMASKPGGAYRNAKGTPANIEVPYTALDPDSVQGFKLAGDYILTVENWTVFRELAAGLGGPLEGLLIYSAGMPAPRWLSAYCRILTTAKPKRVLHWGDPDIGGIRAMTKIAAAAKLTGHVLEPFAMDDEIEGHRKSFSAAEIDYICRLCMEHGWNKVANMVKRLRGAVEQESQCPRLP